MNMRIIKIAIIAALSAVFGTSIMVENTEADTNNTDYTIQTVSSYKQNQQALNQLALTNSVVPSQPQNNYFSQTALNTEAQQVNYPEGYDLNQLRQIEPQEKVTAANKAINDTRIQSFDQIAKQGLNLNNYQSDPAAAHEKVDLNNLSSQQATEMNQYALGLINRARAYFNEQPFIQNQGAINTAKEMAQMYQDNNESLLNNHWHDQSIIGNNSENISAVQIYADNNPRIIARPFATARGIEFINENRIPLFSVNNMDDLRAMIYYGVIAMLFNDASDNYSHAQNFLTNYQPIPSMAVYPSLTDGIEKVNDGMGNEIIYKVKNVDMHFLWVDGSEDLFKVTNGKVYYYGANGQLYKSQWYRNWGNSYYFKEDGSRATSEIVKIGNSYYYFDDQGIMRTNYFLNQSGKVYYFGNDGKEYRNQFYNNWHHTYYFGNDGARYTNQFYNNWGHTYYFGNDGARWDNRFYNNWGYSYYFGADGARYTNQVATINGNTYFFDNQGIMRTNYFLNQNGRIYYFGNDGKEYRNQFYTNWGHTYYFGNNGARYTNQFYNNWGHTYYFGNDGARWDNRWMNAWGHLYYFKRDGSRATNEIIKIGTSYYYFDNQGIMQSIVL